MTMLGNAPDLYPTPLLEGFGEGNNDNNPTDDVLEAPLPIQPTPLVAGFERKDSVRSLFYPGPFSVSPTPLSRGLSRPGDLAARVLGITPSPLVGGLKKPVDFAVPMLGLYPTPQVSGFAVDATRTTTYAEQDAGTNNTSDTVFVDQLTHTVSGSVLAGKTWLVMSFTAGNMGFNGQPMSTRFRNNTGSLDLGGFVGELGDSTDNGPITVMGVVSFGASPGDQTFAIGAKSGLGGIGAKSINNRILLIELTSDDAYSYNASALDTSTSNSTWTTLASATYPAAGDYDVFAFGQMKELASQGNDYDFELLKSDGSRDKYVLGPAHVSTTRRNPMVFHSERLSQNAGDTALLRAKPNSGVTAKTFEYRGIVLLNRRRWTSVGYANDPTTRTPAGTTFAERNAASTLAVTFDGTNPYIVFGNATQYLQSGTSDPAIQLIQGAAVIGAGSKYGGNIAGGDRPFFCFKKYTPSAGASSISWQTKKTISGSGSPDFKFADVGYWKTT